MFSHAVLFMTHSHAQLSVVHDVLHRVSAGVHVQEQRAIGDGHRRVYRGNSARDVDELDVREVSKISSPSLIGYLLKRQIEHIYILWSIPWWSFEDITTFIALVFFY